MAYELDQFISDCRSILSRDPGPDGREEVRTQLEHLLQNPDFVRDRLSRLFSLRPRHRDEPRQDQSRALRPEDWRRASHDAATGDVTGFGERRSD